MTDIYQPRMVVRHLAEALDVAGGSTADGADVIQWTGSGAASQQWSLS